MCDLGLLVSVFVHLNSYSLFYLVLLKVYCDRCLSCTFDKKFEVILYLHSK